MCLRESFLTSGRQLAPELSDGVVLLIGNLGAGKTTLAKGIVEGRNGTPADEVSSPTFTLIHQYGDKTPVFHVDLYRIDTARELETLGLDDLAAPNNIVMVEWGDKFPRFARERDVEISLLRVGEDQRKIQLTTR